MKFKVGDPVRKIDGSYEAKGYVVATFTTRTGLVRYVFEFSVPQGMLHIFNENQLEVWA